MKKIYDMLIGFIAAVMVMIGSYLIVIMLNIDVNKVSFFVGWISCMAFNMRLYTLKKYN